MASTNKDPLTGQPAGLMGGEEEHNIGYIFGSSYSRERDRWQYCLLEFCRNPPRLHRTEGNCGYGHAEFADFCGRTSRETLQSELARAICHFRWKAFSSSRAYVDDSAELSASFDVSASKFRNHQRRRATVHSKHSIEGPYVETLRTIRPQLHEIIREVSARRQESIGLPVRRIVYRHLDRPQSCLYLIEKLWNESWIGEI